MRARRSILFAAEATEHTGAGHLRRSIQFALGLPQNFIKFHLGDVDIEWVRTLSRRVFHESPSNHGDSKYDIVVLDSYDVKFCDFVLGCFPKSKFVQIADRYSPYIPDIAVVWLDHPDGLIFEHRRPNILGAGLDYMPIRKFDRKHRSVTPAAERVLVTTGGSPQLLTFQRLLEAFSEPDFDCIEFHFIGPAPESRLLKDNFYFHRFSPSIDNLFMHIDTVITGCGTAIWDYLANEFCVGAVCLVKNQERNFRFVVETGQAMPLDVLQGSTNLLSNLEVLCFNTELRKALVAATGDNYSFHGAERFANLLLNL